MGTPRTEHHPTPDPADDRANVLTLAKRAAEKAARAEAERDAAIRQAVAMGASLRDVADATGVSHMTVKRIAARPT